MIVRRGKNKEENRTKALAKEREERRKKMLRTKYGQKPLKHSKKGMQSCVYAGFVLLLVIIMLLISFVKKGDVGFFVGIVGLGVLYAAGKGLSLGLRGFRERDKNYITCKVGSGLNGAVLLGMIGLFIRGLF